MRFTKAMIETDKTHFCFRKNGPQYWRHHVMNWSDDEKLAVDFVRKPYKRGWRMNIRRLNRAVYTWNNGWPVRWDWQTAACWVSPEGKVTDINDKRNNDKQKDGSELEDWRDYIESVWEALQ